MDQEVIRYAYDLKRVLKWSWNSVMLWWTDCLQTAWR